MPLKFVDSEGKPIENVKSIYVYADGKEAEFDADQAMGKITALNAECKTWREKAQGLKDFEGLDPAEAREAIAFKKASAGKKGDAEEIQRLVKEQVASYQADWAKKEQDFAAKMAEKDAAIHDHIVGGLFARSEWFVPKSEKEPAKTFLTPGKAKDSFGRFFSVENGKPVAKWPDGSPILSRKKFGEPADFDEAIEAILEKDPEGQQLLRSPVASGGGATGSGQRAADLSNLPPERRLEQALASGRAA